MNLRKYIKQTWEIGLFSLFLSAAFIVLPLLSLLPCSLATPLLFCSPSGVRNPVFGLPRLGRDLHTRGRRCLRATGTQAELESLAGQ